MPDTPTSPRADRLAVPRWWDGRLVAGVLLVLVSVVVGARVLSAADRSTPVFAATHDLAPGSVLTARDVVAQDVRLDAAQVARLVPVPPDGGAPAGYVVLRSVTAGDLVLRSDLIDERGTELRQVTVNVAAGHAPPDLRGGELVDVYVTPREAQGDPQPVPSGGLSPAPGARPRLVLASVAVAATPGAGGFGGEQSTPVVLDVAPRDVLRVVSAVAEGSIDLVRQLGRRADPPAVPTVAPTATQAAR